MQPRLAVQDLACRRGDRLLFGGLTFALGPGAALHVAGPNGIGKSSLLRQLAGLLRAFHGTVERAGSIGLVDERLALDEELPLGKALGFWQSIDRCGEPGDALAILDLDGLLDVPVRYLSTGQRKRAALARLLNGGHAIWLLDEPLNGLDFSAREKVEALVGAHCGGGGICVFASHQKLAVKAETLELERFA